MKNSKFMASIGIIAAMLIVICVVVARKGDEMTAGKKNVREVETVPLTHSPGGYARGSDEPEFIRGTIESTSSSILYFQMDPSMHRKVPLSIFSFELTSTRCPLLLEQTLKVIQNTVLSSNEGTLGASFEIRIPTSDELLVCQEGSIRPFFVIKPGEDWIVGINRDGIIAFRDKALQCKPYVCER